MWFTVTASREGASARRLRDQGPRAPGWQQVGAGLVGVELAAEIVAYFPGLKGAVMLTDLAEDVLPPLPDAAPYARKWLEKNGVKVCCGKDAPAELEKAAPEIRSRAALRAGRAECVG